MKKYLLSLITIIAIGSFSIAQDFEGKITLDIEYSELSEDYEAYEAMLPSEMLYKIKGTKAKIEQESMGASTSTIIDNETKEGVVLMNMMGQKIAIKMDLNDEEIEKKEKALVVKKTDETKEIAGYSCKKAIVTSDDGTTMDVWYTKEIQGFKNPYNVFAGKIDGFPMQYEKEGQGMGMVITVSKIEKTEIKDSEFEVPAGYEEMNMEELKEIIGEMGM